MRNERGRMTNKMLSILIACLAIEGVVGSRQDADIWYQGRAIASALGDIKITTYTLRLLKELQSLHWLDGKKVAGVWLWRLSEQGRISITNLILSKRSSIVIELHSMMIMEDNVK